MEFIEPKPVEVNPKKRRNKIIIASVSGALAAAIVVVGYTHLIKNVFIEFDNINLYTYTYRTDEPNGGITITGIDPDATLPAKLRIPTKLDGRKVVALGDNLFEKYSGLVEVIIPDTVESIGLRCFADCEDLERFNVPSKLSFIGKEAFDNTKWYDNKEDGEVTIGECIYRYKGEMEYDTAIVASEDSPAIASHSNYINISGYKFAAAGAFADKEGLTYVELPDTFHEVTESLFSGCYNLEEVVLDEYILSIGANAFRDCRKLKDHNILTDYVISIGSYAFSNCDLTGDLEISKFVSEIGAGAFEKNVHLTKVTLPAGLTEVADGTFFGCSNLAEVKFNEQDYKVVDPSNEFWPNLGSTISFIGTSAFEGTAISEIKIPYNVSNIKAKAFANCPNLETVYTLENTWGKHQNIWVWDEGHGEYGWEESESTYMGLLTIEEAAFKNSPKFESIVLERVDENNVSTDISPLHEVSLPVTLSNLGGTNADSELFAGTSIKTLNLEKNFANVVSSVEIKDEEARKAYLAELDLDRVEILPPSLCYGSMEDPDHPGSKLELVCNKLTTVDFGTETKDGEGRILTTSTIKKINSKAFKGASSLANFVFGKDVSELGTNLFEDCVSLTSVTLSESLKVISNKCFANCASLLTIEIPESVRTIGDEAFVGCSNLVSVTYAGANHIDSIGSYAFKDCISLSTYDTGACEVIGRGAFSGCTALTSITMSSSNKISAINNEVFKGCSALSSIILDKNISVLKVSAFEGCTTLSSITLKFDGVVKVEADALKDVATSCEIRVPSEKVAAYQADEVWSAYNIVAIA